MLVPESALAEHEDVCVARRRALPASLFSRKIAELGVACALVVTRKVGGRFPYTRLILELCFGTDSWELSDVQCRSCSWQDRVWGWHQWRPSGFVEPRFVPRFLLHEHIAEYHIETRCESCHELCASRRELAFHNCADRRTPWLDDYYISCPACATVLKKSDFPHAACPRRKVCLVGLAAVFFDATFGGSATQARPLRPDASSHSFGERSRSGCKPQQTRGYPPTLDHATSIDSVSVDSVFVEVDEGDERVLW